MKKSLSLLLAIAMVFSMFASVAFANEAETTAALDTDAKYALLEAAGIFEGTDGGDAALDQNMTRAQATKIVTVILGLDEDAAAADAAFDDLAGAGWAKGFIGAAAKAGIVDGRDEGKFVPSGNVTLEELATILVRVFVLEPSNYAGEGKIAGWAKGYVGAAIAAGLLSDKADFTKEATRAELVDSTFAAVEVIKELVESLTVKSAVAVDANNIEITFSNGFVLSKKLETALVGNQETEVKVTFMGKEFSVKVTHVVPVTSIDLKSAVALNSKVVEVALNTEASGVNAGVVSVKDADGNAVAVASAAVAPYSTNGKTVLVTLADDTKVGTLYTITSGSKSVNFGGRAADTTKPTVTNVAIGDEYNELEITFSEAVDISGLTVEINETYGSQASLATSGITYDGSSKVVVKIAESKASTLYSAVISGAKDFAGNVMDADKDKTFVGEPKPTGKQTVSGVEVEDYKTVVVNFGLKVDAAAAVAGNFEIVEAYGTKTIEVESAKADGKKITLTLKDGLSASTLYKLTVSNVGTAYGQPLDSDNRTADFVGKNKPEALNIVSVPVAKSNTTVEVEFENKLDKASAENVANYAIKEAYGDNALAVSKAELLDGNKKVKLTVASMSNSLYSLTVSNVSDIYGNTVNTKDSANVKSFVGAVVANKISSVSAELSATDDTKLVLSFDQNVGSSATDVGHYVIDGGIGYPAKAEITSDRVVTLTISKTNNGQLYNITVKGLENSDGVAMDAAGVKATFVGSGNTSAPAVVSGVVAIDNQTLKVFFDRKASDAGVSASGKTAGKWEITGKSGVVELDNATTTATVDPTNANALVIRTGNAGDFKAANAVNNAFTLKITAASLKDGAQTKAFASNEDAAKAITISGVVSVNKQTIRVYFDQPVTIGAGQVGNVAKINEKADGTGDGVTLSNAVAIDNSKTIYEFSTSDDIGTGSKYLIGTATTPAQITSIYGVVTLKADQVKQFAGSDAAIGSIANVPVTMDNNKTIVVWYPEAMDTTEAETVGNYKIFTAATGGTELVAGAIKDAKYDAATRKVTLTLNSTLGDATGAYLEIDTDVVNALGNKHVSKSDGSAIRSQFAVSTAAAAKVTVTKATYNKADNELKIVLNQKVQGNINVATFNTNFTVKVNGDTATTAASIVSTNFDGTYVSEIVIKLSSGALDELKAGSVELKGNSALTGINGNTNDASSKVVFAQR